MKAITPEVGRRIRAYRKEKKMTQVELAKRANCHVTYIGALERGEKTPSIDTLYRICQGLRVPMSEFLKGLAPGSAKPIVGFDELVEAFPQEKREEIYKILVAVLEFIRKRA